MLGFAVRLFDEHPEAADEVRARHHAFTVDEYQDVNPLQQALLEAWLGGRDDVCVVGDDYQTIYAFTGASPRYLSGSPSDTRTHTSCGCRRTTARRRRSSPWRTR